MKLEMTRKELTWLRNLCELAAERGEGYLSQEELTLAENIIMHHNILEHRGYGREDCNGEGGSCIYSCPEAKKTIKVAEQG